MNSWFHMRGWIWSPSSSTAEATTNFTTVTTLTMFSVRALLRTGSLRIGERHRSSLSDSSLVAKVRKNPSVEAMLPSIDGGGFQRPPSTRRERLHPPFGLLPKCSTGNWDLVKCASELIPARAMYSRNRRRATHWVAHGPSETVLRSLSPSGDINPKATVRRRTWIHLPC